MDAKYYVNECLSAKKFLGLWKRCERSQNFNRIVYLEESVGEDFLDLAQVAGAVSALTRELEAYGVPSWVLRDGDNISGKRILDFCNQLKMRSRRMRVI